ncbi:MAG TPA: nuclear transport factor 2 family protein [Terriglobales bacterium]|jgi:ketosteroid isomerase-like protein|nr:nuclear transport factor 2 family protein [Terriglobales bacterium]
MRTPIALLALALSAMPGLGQAPAVKADADPAAQAEIINLEAESSKLILQGKWDEYSSHLTEDYVRTLGDGKVQSKEETLAEFRTPERKVLDWIPEDLKVQVYGDAAILIGHLSVLSRQSGRVTTSFFRFTQILLKRDGRWLVAGMQLTPVSK